ncbi:MAG TPA: hypothetical protein VMJ11_16945 [Paraburkholderia sp.]|uniref:hypothetical protein n=1 Tax=Paraburkholderia sp. TaxID=1926495 RepID=UPI002B9E6152|nr:hypothetical protein [Paraburkholderia sp.]HTR08298.1 hypothetical protein [Paraburkholderia sp.]
MKVINRLALLSLTVPTSFAPQLHRSHDLFNEQKSRKTKGYVNRMQPAVQQG